MTSFAVFKYLPEHMIKHCQQLLNTDCKVVRIGKQHLYPIFKCGSTSLMNNADNIIKNDKISKLKSLTVFVRDPNERFKTGVNTYARLNKTTVRKVLSDIDKDIICNRHFAPQFLWFFHLMRYYKGNVTIRPIEDIKKYTSAFENVAEIKHKVKPNSKYVKVDQELISRYMNKTVSLPNLCVDLIEHVLP